MKKGHKNFSDTDILDWIETQILTWNPAEPGLVGHDQRFFSVPSQHITNKSFRECCQQAMLMEFSKRLAE